MKKTILVLAGVASMLASVPAAQASTAGGPFNVTVTLTSLCTMATIGDLAFGTYAAFGPVVNAISTTATLTCTRGLAGIQAAFDASSIDITAALPSTNAVGSGVLAGLLYNITATPGTVTAGAAPTAGVLGVPGGSIGSADSRLFSISGTMPANQAGATPIGGATQVRTLTITY
jgi:hypothetical protein